MDEDIVRKINSIEKAVEVVKNNAYNYYYLNDKLKNDKMIIWKGLQQDGWILKYASNEIKDNILFVLEAVKDTPEAIEFATQRIQDIAKNSQDAETNLKAYIKSEKLMHYINKELQEKQGIGTKKIKI